MSISVYITTKWWKICLTSRQPVQLDMYAGEEPPDLFPSMVQKSTLIFIVFFGGWVLHFWKGTIDGFKSNKFSIHISGKIFHVSTR